MTSELKCWILVTSNRSLGSQGPFLWLHLTSSWNLPEVHYNKAGRQPVLSSSCVWGEAEAAGGMCWLPLLLSSWSCILHKELITVGRELCDLWVIPGKRYYLEIVLKPGQEVTEVTTLTCFPVSEQFRWGFQSSHFSPLSPPVHLLLTPHSQIPASPFFSP